MCLKNEHVVAAPEKEKLEVDTLVLKEGLGTTGARFRLPPFLTSDLLYVSVKGICSMRWDPS